MSTVKTIEIECHSCHGTGLYSGMAERDGAYVVCSTCKGTGKTNYSYKEFTGRQYEPSCKRVYKNGMGYVISSNDVTTDEGKLLPFSKEGVSYQDWLNGNEPEDMEFLACPMMADQGACHKIDGFIDRCNSFNGGWISHIQSCKNVCNMDECWQRFKAGKAKIDVDNE
jgi:hypothetical protein